MADRTPEHDTPATSTGSARDDAHDDGSVTRPGVGSGAGDGVDEVDLIAQAWRRERPGAPVASIGVITRIWRVAKLLEDERRRTMARLGMDVATRDLLSTLRRAGPPYQLAPSEIARRALVSPGAVSQRVARAEAAGLVRRRRDGRDGRAVVVELTSEGHQVIGGAVDELLRHEESLLSGLTGQQREHLADLLRVLLADLTERVGPGRAG